MEAFHIYVGSETSSSSEEGVPMSTVLPAYAEQPVTIVMQPRLLAASCVLWALASAVSVAVLVTGVIRLL